MKPIATGHYYYGEFERVVSAAMETAGQGRSWRSLAWPSCGVNTTSQHIPTGTAGRALGNRLHGHYDKAMSAVWLHRGGQR